MAQYHRHYLPGGTFFFTVVTERRRCIFDADSARELFGRVLRDCASRFPFETIAMSLLPDHLHALWTLPPGDDRYSLRWNWIKRQFTRRWLATGAVEKTPVSTRSRDRRRGVWQRRFWEHTIRDQCDLEAHFDYIHYNAVKHGLVARPRDWPWSTFHRWVRDGHYDVDWGVSYVAPALPGEAGE